MNGTTNVPGVCVLIRERGKVLFVLRENTDFKDGEYAVPSGHVEAGETFKQAACRETLEEVGVHVRPEDLVYKLTVQRNSTRDVRIDVWFEALAWTGEPLNTEPNKHAKIEWIDADNLPENIVDYISFGIENINGNNYYAEFGWR